MNFEALKLNFYSRHSIELTCDSEGAASTIQSSSGNALNIYLEIEQRIYITLTLGNQLIAIYRTDSKC